MNYDIDPIIVHTPYTFKQMKEYQRYFFRHFRRISLPLFVFLTFMSLMSLPIIIDLDYFNVLEIFQMFIPAIAMIFALGLMSFAPFYTKKRHKTIAVGLQNGQTCVFRNSEYDTEMQDSDVMSKTTCSYNVIYRAVETKKMFYLFTDKQIATLVDKQGFKNKTPEDLRQLLSRNLPANKCKFLK